MNSYDEYATQYAALIQSRDEWGFSPYLDLVVPTLLRLVGDVRGLAVLDACCGEGYFTRQLAERGAQVIGVDISANLIAMAQQRQAEEKLGITFRVHDLAQPLPEYAESFDLITCNLGLNDVLDYTLFIANLCGMLQHGGRIALSLNNPYSALVRDKVKNYFDSGQSSPYAGLASAGVPVPHYHRTLEDYMREFTRHGLYLRTFSDCQPSPEHLRTGSPRAQRYNQFPFFMALEFVKLAE